MGQVYILRNKSMPGLVKIGYTNGSVQQRAEQLSGSTGIPTPFEIAFVWECSNAYFVEQKIHQKFKRYRINTSREFFNDDCLDHVVEYMNSKIRNIANNKTRGKNSSQKLLLKDVEIPNTGLVVLSIFSRRIPILGILLMPFWGISLLDELFGRDGDLIKMDGRGEVSIARIAYLLSLVVIVFAVIVSLNVMLSLLTFS